MPVISFDKVKKSYARHLVLDGVSFSVMPNEVLGLVGLNGIGKSTLIKGSLDINFIDSGEIKIFSRSNKDMQSRRQLFYLPEKFQPSKYLKGIEYIKFSLSYHDKKLDDKKLDEVCALLAFPKEKLSESVSSYSKGMSQKIGIMSAYLADPKLYILDEPMSGLDPGARIRFKKLLLKEKEAGKTIFFSSHILSDMDEICDRIAILHDRKIIYIGTQQDFKKKYKRDNLEEAFLESIGEKITL